MTELRETAGDAVQRLRRRFMDDAVFHAAVHRLIQAEDAEDVVNVLAALTRVDTPDTEPLADAPVWQQDWNYQRVRGALERAVSSQFKGEDGARDLQNAINAIGLTPAASGASPFSERVCKECGQPWRYRGGVSLMRLRDGSIIHADCWKPPVPATGEMSDEPATD